MNGCCFECHMLMCVMHLCFAIGFVICVLGFASGVPFIDACLFRLKQKKESLSNRKIWTRRSTILPEYINNYVRIYNGKTFVRVKITEGKVGHKFGEFAFTRKGRVKTALVKGRGKTKK